MSRPASVPQARIPSRAGSCQFLPTLDIENPTDEELKWPIIDLNAPEPWVTGSALGEFLQSPITPAAKLRLESLLPSLPDECQEIVRRCAIHKESVRTIATALGLSELQIVERYRHGMKQIDQMILHSTTTS